MNRQSSWLASVTSGLISKPDAMIRPRDLVLHGFLDQSLDRLEEAKRGGNPAAIRCARESFYELLNSIQKMEAGSGLGLKKTICLRVQDGADYA